MLDFSRLWGKITYYSIGDYGIILFDSYAEIHLRLRSASVLFVVLG